MKRLTILIIILTCFTALCLGQRRFRAASRTIIQLTEPRTTGMVPFEEALNKQKDTLIFDNQTIERNQISQLAWAAQGERSSQESLPTLPVQTTSPIQLYLATHEGLFIYTPVENSLQQTINQDIRGLLASAAAPMSDSVATAGCSFILAAPTRSLSTQRINSNRTILYLQAGHIAQNIQLQAVCMDLGSVTISNFERRAVNSACKLPRNIEPLYIICVGVPGSQSTSESGNAQDTTPKRAAVIVPSANYRDEEFFETLRALDAAGIQKIIASTRIGILRSMLGNGYEAGALINQLRVDDYDGIIFIGGAGAIELVYDPFVINLIREAFDKRKIIAASSTAPSILANAGVLKGVKVTASPSESLVLDQLGAVYTGIPVEENMKIITCNGPAAAVPFARTVVDAITGR